MTDHLPREWVSFRSFVSPHIHLKSAPLFRLWAASTVSIAKDRRDITSASDSSASSSGRNRTTAAMLVIKLVPKPIAGDRYRHHGEGEKRPKGAYAYARCELASKRYKPGGGTQCRDFIWTVDRPGPRGRPPPAAAQPVASRSGPGRASRHM